MSDYPASERTKFVCAVNIYASGTVPVNHFLYTVTSPVNLEQLCHNQRSVNRTIERTGNAQYRKPRSWQPKFTVMRGFARAQAAQAHVSRKSQRLIHETVTRCVTRS